MSVTVATIAEALEYVAPLCTAQPWDAVGLQIGDPAQAVTRVLLAVDATPGVLAEAAAAGAQLLVTHHPLLFHGLSAVVAGDPVADLAIAAVRAGLACYSAHTNLDVAPGLGTAAALGAALDLVDVEVLECGCGGPAGRDGEPGGAGRVGRLPQPLAAGMVAGLASFGLGAPLVQVYGEHQREIERLAAVPGSGGAGLAEAAAAGAEGYLTGELKHHEVLQARQRGLCVFLAGHFYSERPVLAGLQRYLQQAVPGLEVLLAEEEAPFFFSD